MRVVSAPVRSRTPLSQSSMPSHTKTNSDVRGTQENFEGRPFFMEGGTHRHLATVPRRRAPFNSGHFILPQNAILPCDNDTERYVVDKKRRWSSNGSLPSSGLLFPGQAGMSCPCIRSRCREWWEPARTHSCRNLSPSSPLPRRRKYSLGLRKHYRI